MGTWGGPHGSPASRTLDPADGGAGKPSSERKGAHWSILLFLVKPTVPEPMPYGKQGLLGAGVCLLRELPPPRHSLLWFKLNYLSYVLI